MKKNIYIVVVTFNPDIQRLNTIVDCILSVECVPILVDNSEKEWDVYYNSLNEKCTIIQMGENKGIAFAQNYGVKYAIEKGAEVIGFFDQDSLVTENIILELVNAIEKHKKEVVAPVSIDSKTNEEYPNQVITKSGLPRDVFTKEDKAVTEVNIVISSGIFVKKDIFEKIGYFDESFFIDFVDIEWCLRCYKKGIYITVINSAKMKHTIGDNFRKYGFVIVNVHSPYRTYYKVRNAFLLFTKDLNILFCLSQLLPALLQNFFLMFDSRLGSEYRKNYFNAIVDGIKKRDGKYELWHEK